MEEIKNNIEEDDAPFSEKKKPKKKQKKCNKKDDFLEDDREDNLEQDIEDDLEEDQEDEQTETTDDYYRSIPFEDKLILELKSLGFDFQNFRLKLLLKIIKNIKLINLFEYYYSFQIKRNDNMQMIKILIFYIC